MGKRINLTKYIGFTFIYFALSLSGTIDLTFEEYLFFAIGVFLMSLDKEVAE